MSPSYVAWKCCDPGVETPGSRRVALPVLSRLTAVISEGRNGRPQKQLRMNATVPVGVGPLPETPAVNVKGLFVFAGLGDEVRFRKLSSRLATMTRLLSTSATPISTTTPPL